LIFRADLGLEFRQAFRDAPRCAQGLLDLKFAGFKLTKVALKLIDTLLMLGRDLRGLILNLALDRHCSRPLSSSLDHPRCCRRVRILDLHPIVAPAGPVGPIAALCDDALGAERARVAKDGLPVAVQVLGKADTGACFA
jgi:hypothetical protein